MNHFRKGVAEIHFNTSEKPAEQKAIEKIIPKDMAVSGPSVGMSIWVLTLPLDRKTRRPAPDQMMLAKNRIEMFCQDLKLAGVAGEQTATGFNITIPDFAAPELSTYVRIQGATLSKAGLTRGQKRFMRK